MSCCSSSTCAKPTNFVRSAEIEQNADDLANLLVQTPEYQEFVRLSQLINLDPDVQRISLEIRKAHRISADPLNKTLEGLETELEALPAVVHFRKSEATVRELFQAVDETISASAGVEFATNARPRGCSCGG